MAARFSLWFPIFVLFVSCNVALMMLARHYQWAGDALYAVSMWSGNEREGMTLNLYGVVPIGYCYGAGLDAESQKRCVVGNDRYLRFHHPAERSAG